MVSDLTLELAPGYNAITGETGAGKSIVIGALNLLSPEVGLYTERDEAILRQFGAHVAVALDSRGTCGPEFCHALMAADQLARRVVEDNVERPECLQADRQAPTRIVRHAPRVLWVRRERRNGQCQNRRHRVT